jgi:hypothetical protein
MNGFLCNENEVILMHHARSPARCSNFVSRLFSGRLRDGVATGDVGEAGNRTRKQGGPTDGRRDHRWAEGPEQPRGEECVRHAHARFRRLCRRRWRHLAQREPQNCDPRAQNLGMEESGLLKWVTEVVIASRVNNISTST